MCKAPAAPRTDPTDTALSELPLVLGQPAWRAGSPRAVSELQMRYTRVIIEANDIDELASADSATIPRRILEAQLSRAHLSTANRKSRHHFDDDGDDDPCAKYRRPNRTRKKAQWKQKRETGEVADPTRSSTKKMSEVL